MPPIPTINLRRPVAAAYVIPEAPGRTSEAGGRTEAAGVHPSTAGRQPPAQNQDRKPPPQSEELNRLLTTLNGILDRLQQLHEHVAAHHPTEIAKLAVEIARRILMHNTSKGDYKIQTLVEEALRKSPTAQNVVVHLNPDDLAPCQELQRQNPHSPFAGLEFTADRSIGRGECLVETPKGIVKSSIAERLERISAALQRVH